MDQKTRLKFIKRMNRKETKNIVAAQARDEELRNLAKDGEEIEGEWCFFNLLPPPMFTGNIFDL